MKPKDDSEGWLLLGLGVLVLAIGFDLIGRLFWFLYGESIYLVIGFVVAAFIAALVLVGEAHKDHGRAIRGRIDEALSEFRGQNSHIEERIKSINKGISAIRSDVEEQSKLYEKAIEQAEALLNPKPVEPIPAPEPTPPEEEQLQEAVKEMVGGAL